MSKKPKRMTSKSRVREDHSRCPRAMWICMCGHTPDIVMYPKFHRNPLRSFGANVTGGRNLAIPIRLLWLLAFTKACTSVQAMITLNIP